MLGLQAKTLARVGSLAYNLLLEGKKSHVLYHQILAFKIQQTSGRHPDPPTPRLAPPPSRVPPIGSCPAAPPSRGCALVRPALRWSNMAASASIRGLGRRVSGQRMGGREGWGRRPVSAHSRSLRRCWRAAGSCLAPGAPCTPPRSAPR